MLMQNGVHFFVWFAILQLPKIYDSTQIFTDLMLSQNYVRIQFHNMYVNNNML